MLNGLNAQSISASRKQGDAFYKEHQYRSALYAYRQGDLEHSKDPETLYKIGVCLYETNDVDGAMTLFQNLMKEKKTDPKVYYEYGRCLQAKNMFIEAAGYYKQYLQKSKSSDPLRIAVKDELIRCAHGNRLRYADELAYVENAGSTINTQFAEFGVRTSPTVIDKIYFNSDRQDVTRGKQTAGNVDIYTTALVNGRWAAPNALPAHINSSGYDEVCGFSNNGQVLYYLTVSGKNFVVRTDTFSTEEGKSYTGSFIGPFLSSHGGTDLFFFNDTICLFASDRPGGYGGYDLYISLLSHGVWSKPTNLGPEINTFYDERFPFLTMDGMTLYFSSDNLESMGGFDIFSSTFNPDLRTWSHPENPGFPINSPLHDTRLVLSPDGMTGYLSSNRKEGYGEEDIYRIFFKQPITAHQHISEVPTFYQLQLLADNQPAVPVTVPPTDKEYKEYFLSHLFLDEHGELLTPQNTKKLDVLANLMMVYPNITAELSCFELPSGQKTFNLYFSIKKAQEAAAYLATKGIASGRLVLKGYGSSFPLVTQPAGQTPSPVYQKLNQRLEVTPHHFESEPVILHVEKIKVPDNLRDPKGARFSAMRNGLYYSVQIASIPQILQNPALESIEDMCIEIDPIQGNYLYMAGMLPTYKDAERQLANLMEMGFPDARIFPYLDGARIPTVAVADYAKSYPDLLFYLAGKRK